jgi:catechol 2,3-dioxygenase-like lactoylglutathione lyase family enzyme
MKPRISMITLGVRDLEESVRFYGQGLGLPRMDSPPEVAFFTLHGSWLGLYGREALAEDAGVPADGTGFAGFTIAHNVDSEAAVDELLGSRRGGFGGRNYARSRPVSVNRCPMASRASTETDAHRTRGFTVAVVSRERGGG